MTYIVTKTINGKQYRYQQTSYRVGKKVKTKSVYLGPVGGGGLSFIPRPIPPELRGWAYIERLMEKYPTVTVETARPALDESPAAVPAPEQSPSQSADAVSDTSGEVDE